MKMALDNFEYDGLLEALDKETRTITLALLNCAESCIGQQLHHTYEINGVDTVFFGTIERFVVATKETEVVIVYSDPNDSEVLPKKEHIKDYEFVADVLMYDAVYRK